MFIMISQGYGNSEILLIFFSLFVGCWLTAAFFGLIRKGGSWQKKISEQMASYNEGYT